MNEPFTYFLAIPQIGSAIVIPIEDRDLVKYIIKKIDGKWKNYGDTFGGDTSTYRNTRIIRWKYEGNAASVSIWKN